MYLQGKNNLRKMFDVYTDQMIINFNNYKLIFPDKNIVNYFESKDNFYYAFLKQFLTNQKKDEALTVDIFYNYFKDKFNIQNDEECAQLIEAIQEFVVD